VNGSKLCKLLRTEPVKERDGLNTAQDYYLFFKTKPKTAEKVAHTQKRIPTAHPREKIKKKRKKEATRRERSHKNHTKRGERH